MTFRQGILLSLMAVSSIAWGADAKSDLIQARANYRQAVANHGTTSPEALKARQDLRAARRHFHAERRQRQQKQRPR